MSEFADSTTIKWAFVGLLVLLLAGTAWVQVRYLKMMRAQVEPGFASRLDTVIRVFNIVLVIAAVGIAIWAVTR